MALLLILDRWVYETSLSTVRTILILYVDSNTVGNIASVASVDWGLAVQIMAAASIGSGLTFVPTTGQTFALYVGLLTLHAIICSVNPKVVARLQIPFIVVNVALCFVLIIGVPATTPKEFRNSAAYAFGDFENLTGWTNGYAFILSFLAPLWAIGAFDSTVHISEEATNADIAIPYAIILACSTSGLLGWAINVALTFCMGKDLKDIVASPIGQPMATILFNSFGTKGTLAVWAWIIIVQFDMGVGMLTTASRQIFAFSRDGALPFSRFIYNVNTRTHAPIFAVWTVAGASLLLGLLAFAGTNAISAIFSLVVAGQYFAYSVPITARFVGSNTLKRGPFSLGKWSKLVAAAAVIWMTFIIVVFLFPTNPAPTSATMNYTVVVLVYGGRHWFTGPVQTISDVDVDSQDTRSDVKGENDSTQEKSTA
ncbi:hypothetical protein C0991_001485 [Blastosporella zonata]|nr:hypothetical protein C0991_001485 [Blastosporella zonata]